MKPWKACLALCILLTPSVVRAQQLPPNAPTRQQVLALFEAIQLRRTMEASQAAAMQQAAVTAQQLFKAEAGAQNPEAVRHLDALLQGVMEDVRTVLPTDKMLEAVVPVYQRHFTSEDINAIIAFQTSPIGKKVVGLQPVMMQETVQALTPLQQQALPELMKRLNERLQKIVGAATNAPKD